MTKLEEELLKAVEKAHYDFGDAAGGNEDYFIATAAAEVAKKHIENAYIEGYYAIANMDSEEWPTEELTGKVLADKWLKENGVIE